MITPLMGAHPEGRHYHLRTITARDTSPRVIVEIMEGYVDLESNTVNYSHKEILRVSRAATTALASLLPIAAIVVLFSVQSNLLSVIKLVNECANS